MSDNTWDDDSKKKKEAMALFFEYLIEALNYFNEHIMAEHLPDRCWPANEPESKKSTIH
jgi:hypothetical protein